MVIVSGFIYARDMTRVDDRHAAAAVHGLLYAGEGGFGVLDFKGFRFVEREPWL